MREVGAGAKLRCGGTEWQQVSPVVQQQAVVM